MPKHLTVNDADEFLAATSVGQPGGVAALDSNGKVPASQIPGGDAAVSSVNGEVGDVVLTYHDVAAVGQEEVGVAGGVATLDGTTRLPVAQLPTVAVQSVNGQHGPSVALGASDVGALTQTAADARYVAESAVGAASGVASLGSDGKVPTAQLPSSSGGAVSSVNGHTGTVVLAASDVGAVATSAVNAASGVAGLDSSSKLTGSQQLYSSTGTVMAVGSTTAGGTANSAARGDHVHAGVTSVNGSQGAVTVTAASISAVPTSEVGAASGVASLDSNGKLTGSQVPTVQVPTVVTLTYSTTVATNAASGNRFRLTMTGNATLSAPSNPTDGQMCMWEVTASGAARTVTLTTGATGAFAFGTDITALSATTSGTTDFIGAVYSSSAARWRVIAYVKGY